MPDGTDGLSRREQLRAAGLAAVAAALVFAGPLFGGRSTVSFEPTDPRLNLRPWTDAAATQGGAINPITPDIDLYVVPGIQRVRQLLADGSGPWWDSAQLTGYPLGANLPFPLFSPVAWPALLLDPVSACDWLLWLHTAAALFLSYRLLRMMGCASGAAAAGAVGFAFSAWMTVRWHLPYILYTAAWAPGLLAALEWLRRDQLRKACLEGACFGGLVLLSGFPQVGLALLGGFALLVLLDRPLRRPRPLAAAGCVLALSGALALPQFVVSGSAYSQSLRSSQATRTLTARQGLPPGALFGAFLPEFFGRPSDFAGPDPPAREMKEWLPQRRLFSADVQDNVVENALYPGVLLLLLLPLALLRRADPRGRRMAWLAFGALAVCLVWPWLVARIPDLAWLGAGNIKRLLVLVGTFVPLTAGLALQAVMDGRLRVPVVWAGALGAGLAVLIVGVRWLEDPASGRFAAELMGQGLRQSVLLVAALVALRAARVRRWRFAPAGVLALDLVGLAWVFNPFPPQHPVFPPTPAVQALAQQEGRIVVLGEASLLPPPAAAVNGLRSLLGIAPMVSARTAELLSVLEEEPRFDVRDPRWARPLRERASLRHPILDLLQVSTVVHADPQLAAATGLPVLFENPEEGLGAVLRPGAGPRAFVCEGAEVVPAAEARLARLGDRSFPVHATVLLEADPGLVMPSRGRMRAVAVERRSESQYALSCQAPFGGVVVLTEAWDPGWTATVDGQSRPVLVADHALLGVATQAGTHEVVFRYAPPGLGGSLVVSCCGLLALLAVALVPAARGRLARPRTGR